MKQVSRWRYSRAFLSVLSFRSIIEESHVRYILRLFIAIHFVWNYGMILLFRERPLSECKESRLSIYLSAEILHFTSFHSEWHACHLERMWEISYKMFYLGWDSSLRYRYVQNDNVLWEENRHENNVIPSEGDSPTRNPMRNIRLMGYFSVLRTSEW